MRCYLNIRLLGVAMVSVALQSCVSLGSLNPFSHSSTKLPALSASTGQVNIDLNWSRNVGNSASYLLTPSVVGKDIFVAASDGHVMRLSDGKVVWEANIGMVISGGIAGSERAIVIGTPRANLVALDA